MIVCLIMVVALSVGASTLHRLSGGRAHWVLGLAAAGIATYLATLYARVHDGGPVLESFEWVAALGLHLSLRADGIGLLMAILVAGVGALIALYSGEYLRGHAQLGSFFAWLMLFMASMLGVALADNVILLFIFWELTSLSSYLLIGFDHERPQARAAALQALLVTGAGGLALLVGLLLLARAGGSMELSALMARGDAIRGHTLYPAILTLVNLGAATKSAQFPFHFWLPNAMEAPTPVSAYLHSATMVKAGVFLLARMSPMLGGTAAWSTVLTVMGAATMLTGAALSFSSRGLKQILAYSTVSALGTLTLLLGLGTPAAVLAAVVYLTAHAFYKGALFMLAGAVSHATGETEADRLSGLRRALPACAAAGALAALSMAGLPPLVGFVGKELLYEAALKAGPASFALTGAVVMAHMVLLAVPIRVGLRPYFGGAPAAGEVHAAPALLWLGPMVLGGASVLCGALAGPAASAVFAPAASSILGGDHPAFAGVALWHGINPALGLSAATLAGGAVIFAFRTTLVSAASRLAVAARFGPAAAYEGALLTLNVIARTQTRVIQSGHLRVYLLITLLTAVGLIGLQIDWSPAWWNALEVGDARPQEVVIAAIILVAALAAVRSHTRLGSVASLGVVGYGVALMFVFFGAPDLAMTQFLIETLMVILFVLVLYHLPPFAVYSGRTARVFDGVVAAAFGGLMFWLTLAASTIQTHSRVSDFFVERSVPDGHSRNVVNVILVDFRAIDTLGEITVLAVAAIGVFALLRLRDARRGGV